MCKLDFSDQINHGNFNSNLDFIKKTKILNHNSNYLEIGSGCGTLLYLLHQNGYDIEGIEIDPEKMEKGRTLYGELPLSLVNSTALPFTDNSFDVVMSFDVFEHIPDTDRHLYEVSRVLKSQGYYILQTPNRLTNVVFETIRWRSFTKWRADHCSLHSYWEIVERFEKHGFDIELYKIPVVNDFFKLKLQKQLGKLGLFLLKIINPDRFPLILTTNFYIKAKKIF